MYTRSILDFCERPAKSSQPIEMRRALLIIHLVANALAIPNMLNHPTEFTQANGIIRWTPDSANLPPIEEFGGDKVCARYYRNYFIEFFKSRAYVYQRPGKVHVPEYRTPWTKYPTTKEPIIEVPVEAIMGELYEPYDGKFPSGRFACYIACQDIRKTLEWVLGARLGISIAIHVRVKFYFSYACPPPMIARRTKKQSWREQETQEEFEDALRVLKSFGKRADFSNMVQYELIRDGQTGGITGCECYLPTDEEREAAFKELLFLRKSKRPKETQSVARAIASKRRTTTRQAWQKVRRKANGEGTSVAAERQNEEQEEFDDGFLENILLENEITAGLSDHRVEQFELEQLDSSDFSQITCYDFDFPEFEVGMPNVGQDRAAVSDDTAFLQASLLEFTNFTDDFDSWFAASDPGSSSGHGKRGI